MFFYFSGAGNTIVINRIKQTARKLRARVNKEGAQGSSLKKYAVMVTIDLLNAILDYSSPSRAHFLVRTAVNTPKTKVTITGSLAMLTSFIHQKMETYENSTKDPNGFVFSS